MKCAYGKCPDRATTFARGRRKQSHDYVDLGVKKYCEDHAVEVADQGSPEYTVECPKCDCRFGVN